MTAVLVLAVASASFLAISWRHVAPLGTLLSSAPFLVPIPMPGWGDEQGRDSSEVFFHIGKTQRERKKKKKEERGSNGLH